MAGLTSLSRKKNIKGQPHKLAYVTEAESDLLKAMGGAGKPVKGTRGIPAYYSDPGDAADMGGPSEGAAESAGGEPEGIMGFSPGGWEGATEVAGPTETGGYRGDPRNFGYSIEENVASQQQAANEKAGIVGPLQDLLSPFIQKAFVPDPRVPGSKKLRKPRRFIPEALLEDPVILAAQTNPEFKKMYDDAIKAATRGMSTTDILGTMDQKGNRTGGYINTLEQGGYDKTWGLGIRGDYEVQAPEGMTKEQYNNYVDLYMAFDGTKAGNLRLELDSVEKDAKTTVGDVFGKFETSPTIYGLDPQMNANKVSEYMDSKALDGIIQGVPMAMGIATGNVSPFFLSDIMGINVIEDISSVVKGQLSGTVLDPLIKTTENITDIYDKVVPSNMDIADRLREQFNIKGQDFFDKNGFYNQAEPTIDSLVPESMVGPVTDIGGLDAEPYRAAVTDISGVPPSQFPDIEPMMLYDPVVDQMPYSPATLEDAIDYSQALERDRDFQEQVNREIEERVFLNPETFPFPERPLELPPIPENLGEAMVDQRGREASIAREAALAGQVAPFGASAVAVPEADRVVERAALPMSRAIRDTPRGSDTLPRLVQQSQPETYEAARRTAAERAVQQIDEDLAGYQSPFQPARPGDVQPETIQLGRDALGLSTEEEVVRDLTRDVIPDRDVVSSELGTLTASDQAAAIPTTEAISQLSDDKINATTKNYLENYVVDNVEKGFMTNEEGNAILAAKTAKDLEIAVSIFMDRQERSQDIQERDLVN